ncbi:SIS domain-containing protein [Chloroflexota bacterium]
MKTYSAEAAHRWKTQINENGKAWAFYEVLPELNHNATVGYPMPAELTDKIKVVMLRSPLLNQRVRLRYQVTGELLEKAGVEYMAVDGEGKSALSQMMSLVLFGDYVSYYLAMLYRIDPSPVDVINYLKGKLAGG